MGIFVIFPDFCYEIIILQYVSHCRFQDCNGYNQTAIFKPPILWPRLDQRWGISRTINIIIFVGVLISVYYPKDKNHFILWFGANYIQHCVILSRKAEQKIILIPSEVDSLGIRVDFRKRKSLLGARGTNGSRRDAISVSISLLFHVIRFYLSPTL